MSGQLPTTPVFNAFNFKDESTTLISLSDSGRRFARKIDIKDGNLLANIQI